jgi:hypothetical protein
MKDIKGFSFLLGNHTSREDNIVILYCVLNKLPYKFCRKPEESPLGYIPVGSVKWCDNFLEPSKRIPDYYPVFLKNFFHRNVWYSEKFPLNKKVFVKPADKHKRFTAFVTSGTGTFKGRKKGPVWCSDIVTFVNEWRYYIAAGKILSADWYSGNDEEKPAPDLNFEFPQDYFGAVDFGELTSGEVALVEANSPYACGWYGDKSKDTLYLQWLIDGWRSLVPCSNF